MLFFFNVDHAIILAEATPTLSLQDTSRYQDQLWLGYSIIDRVQSVCDHTIKLPPASGSGLVNASSIPLNIIDDLSQNEQCCNLP
jgi:hypothetical protein